MVRFVIPAFVPYNVREEPEHTRHILIRFMAIVKSSLVAPSLTFRISPALCLQQGGWRSLNCAPLSHPPTHWHAETCHHPGRGPSDFQTFPEGVGRLFFTARIERPPFYRGGSASKKNGLPTPSHPSEAARCASTGDHQAPSPTPFGEQEDDQATHPTILARLSHPP